LLFNDHSLAKISAMSSKTMRSVRENTHINFIYNPRR
jgi:hypothetical protein